MYRLVRNLSAMQETWVWSLGQEDPLGKETAIWASILSWRILRTEEAGGLQSMGLQRVGHNWATSLHFTSLGNLPKPGIEPGSPTLQADSLPYEPPRKPKESLDEGERWEYKAGLKLNITKTKIMASGPITSWQIGDNVEAVTDFFFLGSEITMDGDCCHAIRRWLLLGRNAMTA